MPEIDPFTVALEKVATIAGKVKKGSPGKKDKKGAKKAGARASTGSLALDELTRIEKEDKLPLQTLLSDTGAHIQEFRAGNYPKDFRFSDFVA